MSSERIDDTTRARADLPGLAIEIVHRRSPAAEAEVISINMQAVPSFDAFASVLEAANPFAFWVRAAQMAWLPWLAAAQTMMLPGGALAKPRELGADKGAKTQGLT